MPPPAPLASTGAMRRHRGQTGLPSVLSRLSLLAVLLHALAAVPLAQGQLYAGGDTLGRTGGTRGRREVPRTPGLPSFGPVPVVSPPSGSQGPTPPPTAASRTPSPTRLPQPSLGLPSSAPAPTPDPPVLAGGIVRTRQTWFSGPDCSGETVVLYSPDNNLCLRAGAGGYRLSCATERPTDAQQPGIGATGAGLLSWYSDASCRDEQARIPFAGSNECISFSRERAEAEGLPGLSLRAVCSDPLGRPSRPSVPAPPLPAGVTLPGGETQGTGALAAGRFRLDFYSDQPGCAQGQSAGNRNRTVTVLGQAGQCLPALGPFSAFQSFRLSCLDGVDTQGLQGAGVTQHFALLHAFSEGGCQGLAGPGLALLRAEPDTQQQASAVVQALQGGQVQVGAVALGMVSGGCIASPLGVCTSSVQAWCGAASTMPPPSSPSSLPSPALDPSPAPAASATSAPLPSISAAPSLAPARPVRALVDVSFFQGTPEGGLGLLGCEVPVAAPQGAGVTQTVTGAAAGSCVALPPSNVTGTSTGPYSGMRVLCDQARGFVPGIPTGGTLRLCRPPVPLTPGTVTSGTGSGAGSSSACGTCDGPARVFANGQCISPLPGTGGVAVGATLACYLDPTGAT